MEALRSQTWPNVEIIVVDNASTDASVEIFMKYPEVQLIANSVNTGFSTAQNQAIRESKGKWVVCLNLDTRAEPTFLEEMVIASKLDDRIGIVCPKVLRMDGEGKALTPPIMDSAGCYVTLELRHHDRGSQEPDIGQYNEPCYVFGYTGAAALFRVEMLKALAVNGCVLDEDFFAYREDADLSWRAQLAGWNCVYTPHAVVYHRRKVFESNRAAVSSLINMHSTKNRFLLRINNVTPGVIKRTCLRATIRDIGVVVYVLFRERSSLPGLWFLVQNWKRLLEKRRVIQSKCVVPDERIVQWFSDEPASFPLDPELVKRLEEERAARRHL
jgi:GT2 family glycosyltransferase